MSEVALLGAGFSKAISTNMPTIAELGPEVLNYMGRPSETLDAFEGSVESWLSHLASDPPWETESDNLRNRASFRDAVDAVNVIISERQDALDGEHLPTWLRRLAWRWSVQESAVVTFNYDTLVEQSLQEVRAYGALADLYAMPLTQTYAAGSGGTFWAGPPSGPMPTLYKLHGSINWLHGGERAPVTERPVLRGNADDDPSPRGRRIYDGLVPLIVPPSSSKGRYYDSVALRAQWRRAGGALRKATSLVIIGYSLPATDLSTRTFLSTLVPLGCKVTVVNPDPNAYDAVVNTVGRRERISRYDSVEEYVDERCGDLVEWWYTSEGGGYVAHFEVNGAAETEAIADTEHPEEWLRDRVRHRWRGLSTFRRDRSRPDGARSEIGYVVARNSDAGNDPRGSV